MDAALVKKKSMDAAAARSRRKMILKQKRLSIKRVAIDENSAKPLGNFIPHFASCVNVRRTTFSTLHLSHGNYIPMVINNKPGVRITGSWKMQTHTYTTVSRVWRKITIANNQRTGASATWENVCPNLQTSRPADVPLCYNNGIPSPLSTICFGRGMRHEIRGPIVPDTLRPKAVLIGGQTPINPAIVPNQPPSFLVPTPPPPPSSMIVAPQTPMMQFIPIPGFQQICPRQP